MNGINRFYTNELGYVRWQCNNTQKTFVAWLNPVDVPQLRYYFDIADEDIDSLIIESDDLKGKYKIKSDHSIIIYRINK